MKNSLTKLSICTVSLVLAASAFAGTPDGKTALTPMAPPCDWHGFYIGLNVGVAGLQTDIGDLDDYESRATTSLEDTNLAVGGQMGYNWQKGAFVYGLEVDADYLNTEKSFVYDNYLEYKAKVDFQGSFRGRAGIAVDNALIYATGGVAVSHGDSQFHELGESDGFETAKQDEWQAGFVAGVGVEYKINCNWSARMEALYTHYPESTNPMEPGETEYHISFQNDVYSVRLGVNYLFGGGH